VTGDPERWDHRLPICVNLRGKMPEWRFAGDVKVVAEKAARK
jgi:hypothetical protein